MGCHRLERACVCRHSKRSCGISTARISVRTLISGFLQNRRTGCLLGKNPPSRTRKCLVVHISALSSSVPSRRDDASCRSICSTINNKTLLIPCDHLGYTLVRTKRRAEAARKPRAFFLLTKSLIYPVMKLNTMSSRQITSRIFFRMVQ